MRAEIRVDDAFLASARDQHIEPPLASFTIHGPEIERQLPALVAAEAERDQDRVALVALNRLQVLHEERLTRFALEQLRISLELFLDRRLLLDVERADAKARRSADSLEFFELLHAAIRY